jgi:hypothetical protein
MANMTNSLGTFFWLSSIYIFIQSKLSDKPMSYDIIFLGIVIVFMYFINVTILQEKCNAVDTWVIIKSTIVPWVFIFGIMMYALNQFPYWKTPFSNTFGLLIAQFGGCNTVFLNMLNPQGSVDGKLHYVYSDPSLLINKFTMVNFDTTLATLQEGKIIPTPVDELKKNAFKDIVKLKELISEWIWYILTASIAISVSYNSLMASKCNKSASQYIDSRNNALAETTEDETPEVYTITA